MKTRVNLYQQKYRPTLTLLSLNSSVFANVMVLVIVVSLFIGLSWRQATLNDENRQVAGLLSDLQRQVDVLKGQLDSQKPSPALVASIEQQKVAISQRQKLLQELSNRELGKQNRFSLVLSDLEQADTANVWLTRIHLQDGQVKLAGYGSTPDAMPKWLANLSRTDSFKGLAFDQARMKRDETAISFELNTQLSEQANLGSKP
ncbi:hypothetical protein DRW07_15645 [Alteromonas sediminis]|uniref:Agglutinin biogenesis protein MshI n=1 Tax=Alteromonas sediminis TaxID=2259342 RepID=A0A3N5XWR9_9ALTE|nr:PilN domain-containing protein [Alteromonas sediminis]RPJ65337.1 hypothetical protein DRW07_15645 [Alteromonas sediminis]